MRDSGAGWEEMVAETRPWVCWVDVVGAAALRACHLQRCPDLACAAWGGTSRNEACPKATWLNQGGTNPRARTPSIDAPETRQVPL